MPKTKVEVYDKDQLIYPFIESDHVTFSNGMKVTEMLDQSISMPTVTHEDLSFKVGVGDQDVSSAIVDSSVSEMTIKGKTYQNILPEPSTHVLTNNKEIFKVNEGLDPNVEIVDGVSKSAILKGQTLVNLATKIRAMGSTAQFNKDTITLTTNTNQSWFSTTLKTVGMKAGGTYLLYTDSITYDDSLSSSPSLKAIVALYEMKPNRNVGRFISNGAVKVTIPSDADASDIGIRIHATLDEGTGGVGKTTTVKGLMIIEYQEGMENWDIPYFEGMTSVKAPVLKSVGKNLLDPQTFIPFNKEEEYVRYEDGYVLANFTKDRTHFFYEVDLTKLPKGMYTVIAKHEGEKSYLGIQLTFKDGTKTWGKTQFNNDGSYAELGLYMQSTTNDPSLKVKAKIMLVANGDTASPYEYYKTNILSTPEEVVLRSLPNGICDTLNLTTGEYVQRISEINLSTSSSATWWQSGYTNDTLLSVGSGSFTSLKASSFLICNVLPSQKGQYNVLYNIDFDSEKNLRINVPKTIANDVSGFMSWLRSNNVIIVGELETPVVKTVDLSSSGNWEKVVLNGSENWTTTNDAQNQNSTMFFRLVVPNILPTNTTSEKGNLWSDTFVTTPSGLATGTWGLDTEAISVNTLKALDIRILKSKLPTQDVAGFKTWLSENPVTVWYQTTTHQDSTQVKQPIFFKDGHIIQSSGVDNSLIPTLDYQAKTSNSYVMDLIKAGTWTVKSDRCNGRMYVGSQDLFFNLNSTNRTITLTQAQIDSLPSKLWFFDDTFENGMILEGDLTSKTIPYFRGIKSTFEDESKIEVLSCGKNLFDISKMVKSSNFDVEITENSITLENKNSGNYNGIASSQSISLKKGCKYTVNFNGKILSGNTMTEPYVTLRRKTNSGTEYYKDISLSSTPHTFTASGDDIVIPHVYASWSSGGTNKVEYSNITIEETANIKDYEPYKSNNTKIPLLSPLRSLPNGVCDEIILDRERNKAQIIQRVEEIVLNGTETWKAHPNLEHNKTLLFQSQTDNRQGKSFRCVSDHFPCLTNKSIWNNTTDSEGIQLGGGGTIYKRVDLRISKLKVSSNSNTQLQNYLNQHPTILLYELETPIITEVDLEGFPYIYKDGHIFLNSEIVPTTEIIYSVNQCQQISASNEDIIRHEKELTYLQKLIAQYVKVDYESVLLSLKA